MVTVWNRFLGSPEHDDAQGDRKRVNVDLQFDRAPVPAADLREAVRQDDHVDDDVGHGAPKTQKRHRLQVTQKRTREETDRAENHPAVGSDRRAGKTALHEVAAQDDVQNAGHEEFNELGDCHQSATPNDAPK